jgi:hypothetical protein
MKETFILRTEWYSSLEELSPKGKAQILDALFLKHLGKEVTITDPTAKICWNFMEPTIEYHNRRYTASVENGKKGGRPKTQEKPNYNLKVEPKQNLTDTVTVTDTVIDIESVTDSVSVTESVFDFVSMDYTDLEAQKLVDKYLKN